MYSSPRQISKVLLYTIIHFSAGSQDCDKHLYLLASYCLTSAPKDRAAALGGWPGERCKWLWVQSVGYRSRSRRLSPCAAPWCASGTLFLLQMTAGDKKQDVCYLCGTQGYVELHVTAEFLRDRRLLTWHFLQLYLWCSGSSSSSSSSVSSLSSAEMPIFLMKPSLSCSSIKAMSWNKRMSFNLMNARYLESTWAFLSSSFLIWVAVLLIFFKNMSPSL